MMPQLEHPTSDIIDWKKTQEKDTRLQYWRKMVETGQKPEKEDTILKRQFSHLHFINDVLHRQVTNNDKVQQQIVLPSAHVNTVLEAMHNDMGHPGKDRTLSLLKDRFYWPGMSKDVEEWISHCGRRIRRKTPQSSTGKYWNNITSARNNITSATSLYGLPNLGTISRRTTEHPDNYGPLHQICTGHTNKKSDSTNNC